jgi:hypothetical protein
VDWSKANFINSVLIVSMDDEAFDDALDEEAAIFRLGWSNYVL